MQKSNSKTNTLFNYFSKSNNNNNKSPKKSAKSPNKSTTDVSNGRTVAPEVATSSRSVTTDDDKGFQLYDLVWAKLEGYVNHYMIPLNELIVETEYAANCDNCVVFGDPG